MFRFLNDTGVACLVHIAINCHSGDNYLSFEGTTFLHAMLFLIVADLLVTSFLSGTQRHMHSACTIDELRAAYSLSSMPNLIGDGYAHEQL